MSSSEQTSPFSTADSRSAAGTSIWLHLATCEADPNMPSSCDNVYLQATEPAAELKQL